MSLLSILFPALLLLLLYHLILLYSSSVLLRKGWVKAVLLEGPPNIYVWMLFLLRNLLHSHFPLHNYRTVAHWSNLVQWKVSLPVAGGLEPDGPYGPFQPKAFYDSLIFRTEARMKVQEQNLEKPSHSPPVPPKPDKITHTQTKNLISPPPPHNPPRQLLQ